MKSPRTLQEKTYQWLLDRIRGGDFLPGSQLKEERLAEEFGVSATPVREALRRLEREGWVENTPYKGCTLKTFTIEKIRELCLLRASVESAAVRVVSNKFTPELHAALRAIVAEATELLEKFRRNEIAPVDFLIANNHLDTRFHSAIVHASGMNELTELYQRWSLQSRGNMIYDKPSSDLRREKISWNAELTIEQHRAIIFSLYLRWEQVAKELIHAHIIGALDFYEMVIPYPIPGPGENGVESAGNSDTPALNNP